MSVFFTDYFVYKDGKGIGTYKFRICEKEK